VLLRAFVFAFFIAAMKAGRCAKEKLIREVDNPARELMTQTELSD